MKVEKGQDVLYVETKDDKLVKKEWTKVKSKQVCYEDWDCWTEIKLENGESVGYGNITSNEHLVFSECNGICKFISDTEEHSKKAIHDYFESRKNDIQDRINKLQERSSQYTMLQSLV